MLHLEAGQMAASDYVSIASKNRLRRTGRPQMSLSAQCKNVLEGRARTCDPETGMENYMN
jgi:hypothetical protein